MAEEEEEGASKSRVGVVHLNVCLFNELRAYDTELILKFWECSVLCRSRASSVHPEHETCHQTSYHVHLAVRNGQRLHFNIVIF